MTDIDTMIDALDIMLADRAAKVCPFCKTDTNNATFRDECSEREFEISGLCQDCQDETFKEE